jgi:hypothetical protein
MILKALFLLGMLALSLSMRLSESHLDEYAEFVHLFPFSSKPISTRRERHRS